jgi:ATP-dependent DNA helicase DinG
VSAQGLGRRPIGAGAELDGLDQLAPFVANLGPLAIVDLLISGSSDSRSAEILELDVVLLDGGAAGPTRLRSGIRPRRPLSTAQRRATGLGATDLSGAPGIDEVAEELAAALRGRTLIAHESGDVRHFLGRDVSAGLRRAPLLDSRDLLALTHPDAPELRLGSYVERLLGRAAGRRGRGDAIDLLALLAHVAAGSERGDARYLNARRALDRFAPDSPWQALLGKGLAVSDVPAAEQFIPIGLAGAPVEEPVPFDEAAIAAALTDEARGRRHFDHYRVRPEQIELMRAFYRNFAGEGTLLLEGGTGVGKSLAYLAAAIPFAMKRAAEGVRGPIVISTRTKLLQDQLLEKDIAAAARMLGHPGLQALSIKGRANYLCEKRLSDTLAEGRDSGLLVEDRHAYGVLMACARTRPAGEVGSLPTGLLRRYPTLRELVHRSVAPRADQCSREECGKRRDCPFGLRRAALSRAHLVVANHDLMLRWPPDYPRIGHVIADEGHELAGVADDVFALVVRPEDLLERIDDVFGGTPRRAGEREPGSGLLPRKQRLEAQKRVNEARRTLHLDLASIGRSMAERASEYGEVQLPVNADKLFPGVARVADTAAGRLDALARLAEELDARAEWSFDEAPSGPVEGPTPVQKNADALRESAIGLRTAFTNSGGDVVAGFERLVSPYDRWTLAIRAVSPASAFHDRFMESLESFAAVSASLFVDGDAFAAMGELEIEERSGFEAEKVALESPFDYAGHMRVAVLREPVDLVTDTADVLARLARQLGGRTLGLFTSLRRMNEVADLLSAELEGDDIEVLAPRRAADDPASLVRQFRSLPGGGVLLGARTFWQGLDIAGDDLQAVVIEKLPFEVPTELRQRRELRIREAGLNAFERYRLGKMLLYLKQMTGRLIRGEDDRGIVVIVEGRPGKSYFRKLGAAFPGSTTIQIVSPGDLPMLLNELGVGDPLISGDSES